MITKICLSGKNVHQIKQVNRTTRHQTMVAPRVFRKVGFSSDKIIWKASSWQLPQTHSKLALTELNWEYYIMTVTDNKSDDIDKTAYIFNKLTNLAAVYKLYY